MGVLLQVAQVGTHPFRRQPFGRLCRGVRFRDIARHHRRVEVADPFPAETVIPHIGHPSQFSGRSKFVHLSPDQFVTGIIPFHIADHQFRAGGFPRGDNRLRLLDGDRHRFLHEDLFPRTQEVFRYLSLQRKIGGHRDGFDFGIGCQFSVIGVETGDLPSLLHFSTEFRAYFRQSDEFAVREAGEVRDMHLLRHEAAAYIPQSDRVHCFSFLPR